MWGRRTAYDVLDTVLTHYHTSLEPRDLFCITAEQDLVASVPSLATLETMGGNLYLLNPTRFAPPELLSSDLRGGVSVFQAIADTVSGKYWSTNVQSQCFPLIPPMSDTFCYDMSDIDNPACFPPPTDQFDKCIANLRAAHSALESDLDAIVAAVPLEAPGEVVEFRFAPSVPTGSSHSVAAYISTVLMREAVMEPLYDPVLGKIRVHASSGIDFEYSLPNSAAQWLAGTFERVLHDATIRTANRVLGEMGSASITQEDWMVGMERSADISLYWEINGGADDTAPLELAFSEFICTPNFAEILDIGSEYRQWFTLLSLRPMLCGQQLGEDAVVFWAPDALRVDIGDVQAGFEVAQRAALNAELQESLGEIVDIGIEQASLLNEIRSTQYHMLFQSRLGALNQALAEAQEAAKSPGLGDILGAVASLAGGIASFEGAAKSLFDVLGEIPADTGFAGQVSFLWDRQDDLSEAGKGIGGSVGRIEVAFSSILGLLDRSEANAAVSRLREAISRVQEEYRRALEDVARRQTDYRDRLQLASAGANRLGLLLENQTFTLSTSAPEIVALNLLAHLGQPDARESFQICRSAIADHANTGSTGHMQNLFLSCLQVSNQVEEARGCLSNTYGAPGTATFATSGSVRVFLSSGAAAECF